MKYETLESRHLLCTACPGGLDATFGNGGFVTTDFQTDGGSGSDTAFAITSGSGGSVVAAGASTIFNPAGQTSFALASYDDTGSLTAFGGSGTVLTELGSGFAGAGDVIVQSDGKVVAVGEAPGPETPSGQTDFAIVRYDVLGNLDQTFGNGGIVLVDFFELSNTSGTFDRAYAVALDAQERIIVAGQGGLANDFAIARLNPDGSLDSSFGGDGRVTTTVAGGSAYFGVVTEGNDILVAGSGAAGADDDVYVARYLEDGNLDTDFGAGGIAQVTRPGEPLIVTSMAVDEASGDIVVAGSIGPVGNQDVLVVRLAPDGDPNPLFGNGGVVISGEANVDETAQAVLVQPDGRIVTIGDRNSDGFGGGVKPFGQFVLIQRFLADGSPDPEVAVIPEPHPADPNPAVPRPGAAMHDLGGMAPTAYDAVLLDDGRLLVAGNTGPVGSDFLVARFFAAQGVVDIDSDQDGVSDQTEDGAPNDGDGDNNGIPDRQENNVTSFPILAETSYLTIVVPDGLILGSVDTPSVPSLLNASLRTGAFAFEVTGLTAPGDTVPVEMIFADPIDANALFKFGPTAHDPTAHWYEFPYTTLDATADGDLLRIQFVLVDGGAGDADLVANGSIVDPSGLVAVSAVPTLKGFTFADINGDGLMTQAVTGEVRLGGWTVFLDDNRNGILDWTDSNANGTWDAGEGEQWTTTNDDFGRYEFTGLDRRTYYVAQMPQPGWSQTAPAVFTEPKSVLLPAAGRSVAIGHLNPDEDALPDMVAVNFDTTELLFRNADGSYTPQPIAVSEGTFPETAQIEDFNTDGLPDVAVLYTGDFDPVSGHELSQAQIRVFLGEGNKQFKAPSTDDGTIIRVSGEAGNNPFGVEPFQFVFGDVNGDGIVDVVTNGRVTPSVSVLLGNGDGTFDAPVPIFLAEAANGLALGNFDADAALELALAVGQQVRIIDQPGVTNQTLGVVDLGEPLGRITVGDFSFVPEGNDDIAVILTESEQVALVLQDASHNVGAGPIIGAAGGDPRDVETADFNRDGRNDIFVANSADDSVAVLLRDDSGTFSVFGHLSVGDRPHAVALGDVDGDGFLDVATANVGSSDVTVARGNPLRHHVVRLGNDPLPGDAIFGNQPLFGGQIRGVAYQDDNVDGQRQAGEPSISGRAVYLDLNNNGVRDVATEPTDVSGLEGDYEFTNLAPGQYKIRVDRVPPLFLNTEPGAPAGQPGVPGSYTVTLGENQSIDSGVDFGDAPPARVEGTVFYDTNGDSNRDANEPPIVNWQIFVDENGNGTLDEGEAETRADGEGRYSLEVVGGTYQIRQVVPAGWQQTLPRPPSGPLHTVTVAQAEVVTGQRFANRGNVTVSGTIWRDNNGDGVMDVSLLEPRQEGATVYVDVNVNNALNPGDWRTTTNSAGNYEMYVPPGDHRIRIVPPTGVNVTTPPTRVYDVTASANDSLADFNFGVRDESNDITGIVYNDRNGDGQFGRFEVGVAGATLYIDANENGRQDFGEPTAVADGQGLYRFANVAAGQYTVRLAPREPWLQSSPADLAITEVDSGFPMEDSLSAVGSFNSTIDAFPDVAYVVPQSPGQDIVRTRLGTGPDRDFPSVSEQTLAPLNSDDFERILYVTVAQVNPQTDNFADIVVVAESTVHRDFRVSVFLGNGDGSFANPTVSSITTGFFSGKSRFVVAHFNPQTDSLPDLVNLEFNPPNPDTVKVFLGTIDGSGIFSFDDAGPRYSMEGPRSPLETNIPGDIQDPASSLAVGDFTGDGILDLAATNPLSDNLTFRAGSGDGTFGPRQHVPTFNTTELKRPAVADFDGDGDDDLVYVGQEDGRIALSWMTSTGNLNFDQRIVHLPVPGDSNVPDLAVFLPTDIDGDGRIDVVGNSFAFRNVGPAALHASIGTTAFVGFETSTFLLELQLVTPTALNLDGDNRDDIAHVSTVFYMDGFATPGVVVMPGDTADFGVVAMTDADDDGVSELTERRAPNHGDGNFDGVPDGSQSQVASLQNVLDGSYITIDSIAAGAVLTDVQSTALPAPPPGGLGMPFGVVDFALTNLPAGGDATIELYVHSPTPVTRYLKYGVEPDDAATLLVDESVTPHWYELAFDPAAGTGATFEFNGQVSKITLRLRDGERGDDDLTANGVIVDPGAPAIVAATLAGDYNNSGQVEQGDLDLVLLNWGRDAAPAPEGWVSSLPEGRIDQDELDAVLLNWGATPGAAGSAVSAPLALESRAERSRPTSWQSAPLSGEWKESALPQSRCGSMNPDSISKQRTTPLLDDALDAVFRKLGATSLA